MLPLEIWPEDMFILELVAHEHAEPGPLRGS